MRNGRRKFTIDPLPRPGLACASIPPPPPAMSTVPTIIYTQTDEAPALTTCSLLPIVQAFT
ncbi:MAG: NADP-dependent isocitrate dehydrogenase, partial [Verrucomicrobia bacterium]|nr:NADP-dependent isocitrate dehydrogenase [Verrucomicrobiota bacterium]